MFAGGGVGIFGMKTVTVQLAVKSSTQTDPFGMPIETEELVDIAGCLVGQPSANEILQSHEMYGKTIQFVIGIPKGDTHSWVDTDVVIWGERYHTVGYPETGIQGNIPLKWGQNVKVARNG